MYYYSDSKISIAALGFFFLLVLGYAGFEARGIISGPDVLISSQPAAVHDPLIKIVGKAERITSLTLNGSAVSVTQDGAFSQEYLLSPGENTITLEAHDGYGRVATKNISYTYQPFVIISTTTAISATTTDVYKATSSTTDATTTRQ